MSFMTTYRGNKFHINKPEETRFEIEDIAHALSNLCRFGGHVRDFYSVAEHSILVSEILATFPGSTPELELWGLMHDATEAYVTDIPTPIKATLSGFAEKEDKLMALIADALHIPPHRGGGVLPKDVKIADRIALVTEARQLLPDGIQGWPEEFERIRSFPYEILPLSPREAKEEFMRRWKSIQKRIARKRSVW